MTPSATGGDPLGGVFERELRANVEVMDRAVEQMRWAAQESDALHAEMVRCTAENDLLSDILERALEACDDVVVVIDGSERIRGWSGGARSRFSTERSTVLGRSITSLRRRGLPSARLAAAARALVDGHDDRETILVPIGASGQEAGPVFACRPVRNGRTGRAGAVVAVLEHRDDGPARETEGSAPTPR